MCESELLGKLEASSLPKAIVKHLTISLRDGKRHRWHDAFDEDFGGSVKRTNELIRRACDLTDRDPDNLLRDTDFDPNDLDPDRLDAAMAELRGIVHLSNDGFTNIKLLRAQPGSRTADTVAQRGSRRYALDVACSSARAARDVSELSGYMAEVCHCKRGQLTSARAAEACDGVGVVFVVNSLPALVFGCQPLYQRAARQVLDALGNPDSYHVAVVTGMVTQAFYEGGAFTGPDDVVYPPWPDR